MEAGRADFVSAQGSIPFLRQRYLYPGGANGKIRAHPKAIKGQKKKKKKSFYKQLVAIALTEWYA